LNLWDVKSATPALILNTTLVSGGLRVPIAPFRVGFRSPVYNDNKIVGVVDSYELLSGNTGAFGADWIEPMTGDIDLATSVGISARFPWIASAASRHR
jgi:hypothetical protein